MDRYDVKRLGKILSVQAEIEGMKADNAFCEAYGETPTFKKPDFDEKAELLRLIASAHNDDLCKFT